jgi:uncharacterized zinc-type alcohol dehydrogenase-like protein
MAQNNHAHSHEGRVHAKGMAMFSKDGGFQPYEFTRHAVGDNDILIEILYAGICHSDIHSARSEWGETVYPIVPGHEIVGRVVQTGKNVSKFKVGDHAGIGCIVNSCRQCEYCKAGMEQFCKRGMIVTFASPDYCHDNELTNGGFSNNYVISEDYALKIPQNTDLKRVASLLCAGITVWVPIHFSQVKRGDTVGVAGFGGLGHMAVKYMVQMGAKVTVFDITEDKRQDALAMGAAEYVNVNNTGELKGLEDKFSFIVSAIPAKYDPMMYVRMLRMDGELAIVGIPATVNQPSINIRSLLSSANRKVYGSMIAGIRETQEMLDYSVTNNIYPDVEIIRAEGKAIDEAFLNVIDGKVKFRYVIDMKTLNEK